MHLQADSASEEIQPFNERSFVFLHCKSSRNPDSSCRFRAFETPPRAFSTAPLESVEEKAVQKSNLSLGVSRFCELCVDSLLQVAHLYAAFSLLEDLIVQNWGTEEQPAFSTHPAHGLGRDSGGNFLFLSYNYSKHSFYSL